MAQTITITINGKAYTREVEERQLLAYFIRDVGLTGTHVGCDTSSCGVCTVLVGGVTPLKSCTAYAVQFDGMELMTVEGLMKDGKYHPIQQAFWDNHGLHCGYCTPAMMLVSYSLLQHNLDPSDEDVRFAISGNLCRCTGYQNIVKAVQSAAVVMREEHEAVPA